MKTTVPVLAILLGLSTAASAATIISGDLFITTYQNQGGSTPGDPNVWKVSFIYDSAAKLCLSAKTLPCPSVNPVITPVKALRGADGLIFDPNDSSKLLIGEQYAGLAASIGVDGNNLVEVPIDSSQVSPNYQAFAVTATPDKTKLLVFPNDTGSPFFSIVGLPLATAGSTHTVTGLDTVLKSVAFDPLGTAYYGDAPDGEVTGHLGILDLSAFSTSRVNVHDSTFNGTAGQGSLPSHSIIFDSYSGCMIMSSSSEIWQLCPDGIGGFNIVSKISTPGDCVGGAGASESCVTNNWDQVSTDGMGHLFAANNDGDLLFIDYKDINGNNVNKYIGNQNYSRRVTLISRLDDIANGGGVPPTEEPQGVDGRMTGGGSVFTGSGVRVTHGFELHCDIADLPNNLEINWGKGNNFHLTSLTNANCFDDPLINPGHPKTLFDTFVGTGVGKLNGVPGATVQFTFTDAGEPGKDDTATISINGGAVLNVTGNLKNGNQQAHLDNK